MNVSKFNHEYLRDILTKIKTKKKNIILTGDFNVNLINYNKNRGTYEFLEQLFNHKFTPQITLPTRITEKAATKLLKQQIETKSFDMGSFKIDLQGTDQTFTTHNYDVNLGFEAFYGCLIQP